MLPVDFLQLQYNKCRPPGAVQLVRFKTAESPLDLAVDR
jgi:hypothetical protein